MNAQRSSKLRIDVSDPDNNVLLNAVVSISKQYPGVDSKGTQLRIRAASVSEVATLPSLFECRLHYGAYYIQVCHDGMDTEVRKVLINDEDIYEDFILLPQGTPSYYLNGRKKALPEKLTFALIIQPAVGLDKQRAMRDFLQERNVGIYREFYDDAVALIVRPSSTNENLVDDVAGWANKYQEAVAAFPVIEIRNRLVSALTGSVIVRFKSGITAVRCMEEIARYGFSVVGESGSVPGTYLCVAGYRPSFQMLNVCDTLFRSGLFDFVTPVTLTFGNDTHAITPSDFSIPPSVASLHNEST